MDDLEIEARDHVLRLTVNRPDALNALSEATADAIAHALEEAAADVDVRAVVLTGAGRAFSAGADLTALGPEADFEQVMARAARMVRAIPRLDLPVVASVNGPAVGVACGLALACDLVVAAESASFLLPFTRIGLMPDGGTTLTVAASVGRARAMRMALLAEPLTAREAYDAGLVAAVVAEDELEQATGEIVARLVEGPPLALAASKRAINAATIGGFEDALDRESRGQLILSGTADLREGLEAFVERRRPTFTGE